jgi:hypothetical protein
LGGLLEAEADEPWLWSSKQRFAGCGGHSGRGCCGTWGSASGGGPLINITSIFTSFTCKKVAPLGGAHLYFYSLHNRLLGSKK